MGKNLYKGRLLFSNCWVGKHRFACLALLVIERIMSYGHYTHKYIYMNTNAYIWL